VTEPIDFDDLSIERGIPMPLKRSKPTLVQCKATTSSGERCKAKPLGSASTVIPEKIQPARYGSTSSLTSATGRYTTRTKSRLYYLPHGPRSKVPISVSPLPFLGSVPYFNNLRMDSHGSCSHRRPKDVQHVFSAQRNPRHHQLGLAFAPLVPIVGDAAVKDASFKPPQQTLSELLKRGTESSAGWQKQKQTFAAEVTKLISVLSPYGKIALWCTAIGLVLLCIFAMITVWSL
jgi:hypothetical protein